MKHKIAIFAFVLSLAPAFFAQDAGGLSFLKIGFDARNTALGDVGVIAARDVSAAAYNPAMLAFGSGAQISFTHNSWMTDVAGELFGAKFNLFGINFGASINSATIKDIEVREKPGEAVATFNANYFSGGLSAGFFVTEKIAVGIGAKFIYESLFSEDANGFGFDFGAHYSGVMKNLDVSFAVQNIGSMNALKTETTDLPSSAVFGASYVVPVNSAIFGVTAFVGARKYFNEDTAHFNFAAEGNYKGLVFFRAGYQTGYEARGYSLGVGFSWHGFGIDYAYAPFDYGLGSSHVIGVKYLF